jgi:hypothetical protein
MSQTDLQIIEACLSEYSEQQVNRATSIMLAAGIGLQKASVDDWRAALHLAAQAVPR